MKISIKNIGKVSSANVTIDGITVIAGENNTGKSTVGKALYALFNTLYNNESQIQVAKKDSIRRIMSSISQQFTYQLGLFDFPDRHSIIDDLYDANNEKEMNVIIREYFDEIPPSKKPMLKLPIEDLLSRISEVKSLSNNEVLKTVLSRRLRDEFNGQTTNMYNKKGGEIQLELRKNQVVAKINSSNKVAMIKNEVALNTEAIYIDDPFVVDELGDYRYSLFMGDFVFGNFHRTSLLKMLRRREGSNVVDEILFDRKFEEIIARLDSVCNGNVTFEKNSSIGFRLKGTRKSIDLRNLSTGLKTFVIIRELLQNGSIEENGTIILDEPEIHLHPEWQIVFAELVVLLNKVFGIHVLLNTHSPYFLQAIEVYAGKHGVSEKARYYFAKNNDDGLSEIIEVTGNLETIYQGLANPLQILENLRWTDNES